jgi:hypothetical protein
MIFWDRFSAYFQMVRVLLKVLNGHLTQVLLFFEVSKIKSKSARLCQISKISQAAAMVNFKNLSKPIPLQDALKLTHND